MAKKTKKQKAAAKAARTRAANKNKKKNNNKKSSQLTKQFNKVASAAGSIAGLAQITAPDMAASAGQPIAVRVKNFINSLSGRTTGYSPFADTPNAGGKIPQTVSIDGMFNKYSGLGIGMLIYSALPAKKYLPHQPKAKTLGKSLLGGGIIGGAFSAPTNPHNHSLIQSHTTAPHTSQGMIVT